MIPSTTKQARITGSRHHTQGSPPIRQISPLAASRCSATRTWTVMAAEAPRRRCPSPSPALRTRLPAEPPWARSPSAPRQCKAVAVRHGGNKETPYHGADGRDQRRVTAGVEQRDSRVQVREGDPLSAARPLLSRRPDGRACGEAPGFHMRSPSIYSSRVRGLEHCSCGGGCHIMPRYSPCTL